MNGSTFTPTPVHADVTVIILTYNEALHIARAIASVRSFARAVIVVDSLSDDGTQTIARNAGAQVVEHPFVNQAKQFNWALDTLPIHTAWVMRLDADETVDVALGTEIIARLDRLPSSTTGVTLDRRHIFMDRWIRHGGRFPLRMLRIWRTGKGRVEDLWMDEHVKVADGNIVHFRHLFSDHNLRDLSFFTRKHNDYATREAAQVILDRYRLLTSIGSGSTPNLTSRQARVKRFIKTALYNRIPFPVGVAAYFIYRYIIQLGFLDGMPGLIYHGLQGFWYRFLVGAKIFEFERAIAGQPDRLTKLDALRSATGLKL